MQVDHTSTLPTTLHHVSPFFPDFFSDYLIRFTLLTILGNVHRPCKLYLNILNNSTSCLSFFPAFIPDFLIIFTLITILGDAHRPHKYYPIITTNRENFLSILNNIFKPGTSFRHWKCWMFGFSDYLFVFVCIYCHFTIILQVRSTWCKKNCVIWTRIGRATLKSLFSLKMMTKQWHAPRIVWALAGVQTILGARHCLVIVFSENKWFWCNSANSSPNDIK